jgi:hypothetical protein
MWVANNVAEYFFCDQQGFLTMNDKKVYDCYFEFTETMITTFNDMKKQYEKLISASVRESDLAHINFPVTIALIETRGLDYFLLQENGQNYISPSKSN